MIGGVAGIGLGYEMQTLLNDCQEPTPPDGIIGAFLGGIAGSIIAKTIIWLRGTILPGGMIRGRHCDLAALKGRNLGGV